MTFTRTSKSRIASLALASALGVQAILLGVSPSAQAAVKPIALSVDGAVVNGGSPILKNGVALLPLDAFAAAIHASAKYNETNQAISLKQGSRVVILQIGSKTAKVNGEKVALSSAPVLVGTTPYVPARFVTEAFGGTLNWNAGASSYEVSTRLHAIYKDGHTSFINTFGEALWSVAGEGHDYSEGLALIKQGDLYGYLDKDGKLAIQPQFSEAYDFSDGLALVAKDGVSSYIDRTGAAVLTPSYDELYDFSEGLALVRSGESFGYIDKTGKLAIAAKYEDGFYFSGGLAAVQVDGSYGYINKQGALVVQPIYHNVSDFTGGLALVQKLETTAGEIVDDSKGVFGYLGTNGVFQIPAEYTKAFPFSNGLAAVEVDGVIRYIDKTGTVVLQTEYADAGNFSEGLASFFDDATGKYGFIDKKGNIAIKPAFDQADDFAGGLAHVVSGDIEGYVNAHGEFVAKWTYVPPVEDEEASA